MNHAVTIRNVHKVVDNFQLESIQLEIEKGTITALIGKNGAGKSTILNMMMNLVKADGGDIQVLGQSVSAADESWKTYIAYLPQNPPMTLPFTGQEMRDLIASGTQHGMNRTFKKSCRCLGLT